ncbi:DMT family transporter [Saccharibacillus brassicae]|uniref:DMT family transporter n=1 Tax=Saccharibacillus brassicae TaxID=2583377 RepID=UPI00319E6FB6
MIAALIAIVFWSTSFVGTKIAYASFPPLTLGAARFAIASLILGGIVLLRREFVRPAPRDLGLMALSGLLGTTVYFALENIGVQLTTASSAALIVASYPAVTALLELFFTGRESRGCGGSASRLRSSAYTGFRAAARSREARTS